jgi:hypothetical protein
MDAQTARCNRPNFGTLVISATGYIVIIGGGALWIAGPSAPRRTYR